MPYSCQRKQLSTLYMLAMLTLDLRILERKTTAYAYDLIRGLI